MEMPKSRQVRKRKFRALIKLIGFFAVLAFLIYVTHAGARRFNALWWPREELPRCAHFDDYSNITCDDDYEERRMIEYDHLLNDEFDQVLGVRKIVTSIREFDPEDLSDVPVVEGGLYTDRQDLEMPREGEKYITFAEYLNCLSVRLSVDYRNKREEDMTKEEVPKSFPYVLSMVTVDLSDMKTLMCNISVPIKHMMYVINSDITPVMNFFHDVEKAFKFTNRLRIVWPGYNMGFAGAVNSGMRDALRYSFREVPFFFILNNDVRFPEETLSRSLPAFRNITRRDRKLLMSLRKEVAAEPSEHTPLNRRYPLLRSSDNSTLLVTSTSLPDRIRYMPYAERKKIFRRHGGALFFNDKVDTAAFGMSRLAMETVGFMDENFYPAYSEDSDWRGRQLRLGLRNYHVKGIPFFVHYVNSLIKMSIRHDMRPGRATEAEVFAKGIEHFIRTIFNGYHKRKKFVSGITGARDPYPNCHELPLDAWVMDVKRRNVLLEAYAASRKFFNQTADEKKGKDSNHLLGWLPESERKRLLSGFPGDSVGEAVSRGFYNCSLVQHAKPQ